MDRLKGRENVLRIYLTSQDLLIPVLKKPLVNAIFFLIILVVSALPLTSTELFALSLLVQTQCYSVCPLPVTKSAECPFNWPACQFLGMPAQQVL